MDPLHMKALSDQPRTTETDVDAFYEAHGGERLLRLRRALARVGSASADLRSHLEERRRRGKVLST